jgi:hypothetical protein
MAILIFDIESNNNIITTNTVTAADANKLYTQSISVLNVIPSPPYKGELFTCSNLGGSYKNSYARMSFNTSTISTDNAIISAKILLCGKLVSADDNATIDIYVNSKSVLDPTYAVEGSSLYGNTYQFFGYSKIKIGSIQFSSFTNLASEIREFVIPSYLLGQIERAAKTEFILRTNYAEQAISPTGKNEILLGHAYSTVPDTPLKTQLIVEVVPTNPSPSGPVVFESISAPQILPSFVEGEATLEGGRSQFFTQSGTLKFATLTSKGFHVYDCSSILSPTKVGSYSITASYPSISRAGYTFDISADGTRCALPVLDPTDTYRNKLLYPSGNSFINGGGYGGSSWMYGGKVKVIKVGTRYFSINVNITNLSITDVSNFVMPDTGDRESIPSEVYPDIIFNKITDPIEVTAGSQKLVIFADKLYAKLYILDMTNPGVIGDLVHTCPITTIDLTSFGYMAGITEYNSTYPTLRNVTVSKHPITNKVYVSLMKGWRLDNPDYTGVVTDENNIKLEVYELENLSLVNKKEIDVIKNSVEGLSSSTNIISIETTKTAYVLFTLYRTGYYQDKPKIYAYDLAKTSLIDCGYVTLSSVSEQSVELVPYFSASEGALYLYSVKSLSNPFLYIYKIGLSEEGVVMPPSGSSPTINSITFTPSPPQVNIAVTIGVNASTGSGGAIAQYIYDFGDRSTVVTSFLSAVAHTYTSGGSYTVICTVVDVSGARTTKASTITVDGDVTPYPVPPSAPRNLSAITDNGQITLSWLPPINTGGAPIVQYNVSKAYANIKETITTSDALISYTFTGLVNGEVYTFSVAAINSANLLGPYTQDLSVSLSSSVSTYNMISWKQVNGNNIKYTLPPPLSSDRDTAGTPVPVQVNGLSVKTSSTDMSNLYEVTKLTYANVEEVGKFSLKTVFRRENPMTVGFLDYYKEAPSYKITSSYKLFIENLLYAAYPYERPAPWLTKEVASTVASYSAFPGDIIHLYDYTLSIPLGTPVSNTIMEDEWRYNIDSTSRLGIPLIPVPGWAYTYSHTRPFLLFDTTSVSGSASILEVRLKAKYDSTRVKALPDIQTLYFKKALLTSNENLTTEEYFNLSDSKGQVTLSDTSLDINVQLDPSIVTSKGFTKIAITSNLDSVAFPSSWNSITYKDVSLEITYGIEQTTVPSGVTNLSSSSESRKVTLTWDPPLSDGGSGVTGYVVKNTNTGEVVFVTSLTNRTYTYANLVNDTSYTFSVSAINALGEGVASLITAVPSNTSHTPPSPVQNLEATALNGAVDLSWNAPVSTGGSPITGYIVYNLNTDYSVTLGPVTYMYTDTGLTNNVSYSYRVSALNTIGASYPVTVTASPTDVYTVPPTPTIVSLTTTSSSATCAYVPTGDGGSPLTGWYLKITNLNNGSNLFFTLSDPLQLINTFTTLHKDIPYVLGVAALNAIGRSSWAYSAPFALNDEGNTLPLIKATIDYNYEIFYPAPVDLNLQSPDYLSYVYPETVYEDIESYIQGIGVEYPVIINRSQNKLFLNLSSVNYIIDLLEGQWSLEKIVSYLDNYFIQRSIRIKALAINNNLILKTVDKGENIVLNFGSAASEVSEVNSLIFGTDPLFVSGTRLYSVENHVPTTSYDATTDKVLVESKPSISVKPYTATTSFVKNMDDLASAYSLQLPNLRIKPNSVSIHYYTDTNSTVFLRDYLGDGVLRVRVKEEASSGDPISFSYLTDQITKLQSLGTVDYENGTISDIIFPDYINSSGEVTSSVKTPVLVGTGVQWPVVIPANSFLFVTVNKINYLIAIAQKSNPTDLNYTLTDVINALNGNTTFKSIGLIAGNANGQLYIKNVGYDLTLPRQNSGPDKSLSLMNAAYTPNSANFILFGLRPRYIGSSPFYISYSYEPNYDTKYKHIWYQTPHFTLVSKGNPSNFITNTHLNYLLEKLNVTRPANTTLDNISFNPTIEDIQYVNDNLNLLVGYNVQMPVIEAFDIPGTFSSGSVDVKVINPDEQENISPDAYTYL